MTTRIKLRRDTAANWTTENPILAAGEPGLETDTGKVKYGDGTTAWTSLTYSSGGGVAENTRRGFINVTGIKPNSEDDVAFEAVAVHGDYAYVLGGADELVDDNSGITLVYKYNLLTGEQVWVKKIVAGSGAQFSFSYNTGTITLTNIDSGGTGYAVGEELYIDGSVFDGGNNITNLATVTVDTVNTSTGAILTASVNAGWTPTGSSGTVTFIGPRNDNAYGDGNAIAYDEFTDEVLVVTEFESGLGDPALDDFWSWTKITHLDPDTGAVVDLTLLTDEGDIFANTIKTYNKAGGIAIVGEKYGEYRTFGTLTMADTGDGYFDILKTELDAEHYPGAPYNNYYDFWISGTGIGSMENVDNVNYYGNLTGTLRQGSGATFDVVANDGDPGIYSVTVTNGGTNYLPNHKIKILGSALGGVDSTNDLIISVNSTSEGAIDTVVLSGTADGGAQTTYTAVTGTNYQVGSGASLSLYIDMIDGSFSYGGTISAGSGYVAGDVIVVDGTTFAAGSSGTNDATFTIGAVDGSGALTSIAIAGTGTNTHLRINVNGVDFTAGGGSWSIKQNLGGEAFIWTPDWSNAIGGPSGDRFYDVCWTADGEYLYAVGRGVYEVDYLQALVVKFNASTGAIVWSKDIKFDEAADNDREARAVCLVPGSTDIMVAGGWYNDSIGREELILTRMTADGSAVWTKTYNLDDGSGLDYEMNLSVVGTDIVLALNHGTDNHNSGLAYLIFDEDGVLNRHRVLSSDGNGNFNYWNTPTANFADIYSDATGDYLVMAGYTYVPTDNYQNALLVKLPLDGYKPLAEGYPINFAEHVFATITWNTATNTAAFASFTATEHVDTITTGSTGKVFVAQAPINELPNHLFTITDDSAGYIEYGDGSKQAFATHIVPQIEAANDYYLTAQDSGKHIFFEDENGRVYIPHWTMVDLPVGFTFTIVNTTGNDCYVDMMYGSVEGTYPGTMKLAGRNISTPYIGIPDSGSGSMVTLMKIKNGYNLLNTDIDNYQQDVWIVSGPGDVYDND